MRILTHQSQSDLPITEQPIRKQATGFHLNDTELATVFQLSDRFSDPRYGSSPPPWVALRRCYLLRAAPPREFPIPRPHCPAPPSPECRDCFVIDGEGESEYEGWKRATAPTGRPCGAGAGAGAAGGGPTYHADPRRDRRTPPGSSGWCPA